ncbi:protein SSUH2 homolog isoform X2 [Patiria miniata]|uniref:Protein SSUH2 homolog n=1 Tax=Patiria miniata TaxID=46514 RepID=A0A914BDW1_PATMI|nr:protein SSUH2 homolog isoform X2 [Patiria miniata]XP_038073622.1 protein SSUH2 homolog isoform X2 [Patiria miniata]
MQQPQGSYPPQSGGYQQGGAPQGYPQPQGQGGGYPQPQGQGGGYPQPQGQSGGINTSATQPPAAATAPPSDNMDAIAGYGNFGAPLAPPSYDQSMMEPPQRSDLPNMPTVTVEQAREALLSHVAENCCYGKKAAQEMVFNDISHSSAFHYKLETFTEKRTTAWASEPFKGQMVDGPANGPAPGPWDMQCNPPAKFKNHKTAVEVPHTASVKIHCHHCNGSGHVHSPLLHDDDHHGHHHHDNHVECTWCHGTGHQKCKTCHGHGQVTCGSCAGAGNLKVFIKLTIEWFNHLSDSIVERTSLPDELIRGVTGEVAFTEEQPRVWPINHFPDQTINQASKQLVQQHTTGFPLERIISQRHSVRVIPVAQAMYKWKETQGNFFVYGFEHKVHAPDYPQQCCCGCTII